MPKDLTHYKLTFLSDTSRENNFEKEDYNG